MNTLAEWLSFVITTLQSWPACRSVRVLEAHQFSERQFALKARAELANGDTLQVHLYHNDTHTDYAYHVYGSVSARWDNKEHFPALPSHPHHFHNALGQVENSPLTGDPTRDLPLVLGQLALSLTQ